MSTPLEFFTAFVKSSFSEDTEVHFYKLRDIFHTESAPKAQEFISLLPTVKSKKIIPFLVSLFELYLPSSKELSKDKRDPQKRFISELSENIRKKDISFLTTVFQFMMKLESKGKLTDKLVGFDVLFQLFSKYSGIYPNEQLENVVESFEEKFRAIDLSSISAYTLEEDDIYPQKDVYFFIRTCFIYLGLDTTATLLTLLEGKSENLDEFDLEMIWLSYSEFIVGFHACSNYMQFLKLNTLIKHISTPDTKTDFLLSFF